MIGIFYIIILLIEVQVEQSLTPLTLHLSQLLFIIQDDSQGHAQLQSLHRYREQRHLNFLYNHSMNQLHTLLRHRTQRQSIWKRNN